MNRPAFLTGNTSHSVKHNTPDEIISDAFDLELAPYVVDRVDDAAAPPCATFAPVRYEPRYAYPLVIWLHGPRGNEHQLRRVMPYVSDQNFVGIAPRGTCADDDGLYDWQQTREHVAAAEARVFAAIELAERRFHVNPDRVFLAGYGSGGTMALRVAWDNPHHFAGVAAIGGPIPAANRPFSRVNEIRCLPCLLAVARESDIYPEREFCRDLRLLHTAGCKVDLHYYRWGDELNTETFQNLNRWLMTLVCGTPC